MLLIHLALFLAHQAETNTSEADENGPETEASELGEGAGLDVSGGLERISSTPSTPKAARHAPHAPAPPSFSTAASASTATLPAAQNSKQQERLGGATGKYSPPAGAHVTQSPKHGATLAGNAAADSDKSSCSSSGVASAQPSVTQSPYRSPPSAGGGLRMMGAVVHDRNPARGPPPPSQRCMTRRTSVKDDIEIPNAIDNNLRLADDSDISRTSNNAESYALLCSSTVCSTVD